MNIGKVIKSRRQEAGMKQMELATKAGISQTSVCLIEKNVHLPHPSHLLKICEILKVPLPILYFEAMEPEDLPKNKRSNFEKTKQHAINTLKFLFEDEE